MHLSTPLFLVSQHGPTIDHGENLDEHKRNNNVSLDYEV
jgi:hypothetical protein